MAGATFEIKAVISRECENSAFKLEMEEICVLSNYGAGTHIAFGAYF